MPDNVISLATRKRFASVPSRNTPALVVPADPDCLIARTPRLFPAVPGVIADFCRDELGCAEALAVPIVPVADASIRSLDNVVDRIAEEGGEVAYGWKIAVSDLFIRAEFHAVLRNEHGLFDPTPDGRGQSSICFAFDPTVPERFDFLQRPGPYSVSTYVPPTKAKRCDAAMSATAFESICRRAAQSGMAPEDLVTLEMREDRLDVSLPLYLRCADELDLLEMRALDGMVATDFATFDGLLRRKLALQAIVLADFARRAPLAAMSR